RKQADQKFKELLEAAPDAMVIVNRNAEIVLVNAQAVQLFGWRREDLLGQPMEMLVPERLRGQHPEKRNGFFAQPRARPMGAGLALFGRRQDGSEFPIEISLSPLETNEGTVAIAAIRDITERKRAEQKLRESERRFGDMLGNVELVSLMLDRDARITYCNDYLLRLTGWRSEEVIGRDWFELFIAPELHHLKTSFFQDILANRPEAMHDENEILTRSGERRLIHWNNSVLRSDADDVIGVASIGEDITERKAAERTIKRLNRVYAVLSGINTLIVRVRDRDELFREACRVAVESGGFRMAMIAIAERGTLKLAPAASAGKDDGLLNAIKGILASSDTAPKTMSARALRDKKAVVSNDSHNDPQVLFSSKYAESGVCSMAVLPLLVANEAVGVLALYAGEIDFFQEEELKLLTELAGDIGLAMDHIDKQERLNYLAYYDALTGLANRTLFLERVAQYLRGAASGGHPLALFLIDLERFKNINDSLGRLVGDELLRQVAQWLTHNTAGDVNLLARVGADHFAVVMPVVKPGGDLTRLVEKWIEALLKQPFRLNDDVFRISAKIGVAQFPKDGVDADTLYKHAEAALKRAKARGERYLFYTPAMTEAVPANLTLENQLRQALDNEEFVLYYQPKVNLVSGKMTSAEALIRWNDPRTGLVPPAQFIPILEETGLIHDVGRWALRQAIKDYLRWRAAGLPAVRIAVNVSPRQLRDRGFIKEVRQAIAIDKHAAAGLELEITESLIMENVQHSIASLHAIRDMGLSIAIDDFGTGFSSLSYLSKFPVNTLKIDRSFVIEMTDSPQGLALVSTIINLAHALQLKVVAEGVETEEQARLLRLLNCDEMQGYLHSMPLPCAIFESNFLALPPAG
ncbi:MAG: EAL domain-containing protein, partial [Rhodoferax sp.]|uniref:sensor domain-containing protein n=1 Tax=Rhodoferax sp. TaxID=50421 RepID=UPI0013FEB978